MIFFADGIGIRERDDPARLAGRSGYEIVEMEPMTLLPALAVVTKHIGLVTTASTTYNEPFNIARKFATLDLISNGRAGWNVVTSWSEAEANNFNREQHVDYDTRYERAAEFVEVVKGCGTAGRRTPFPSTRSPACSSTRAEDARARPQGQALHGARPAERRRHAAGHPDPGAGRRVRAGTRDRRRDRRRHLCRRTTRWRSARPTTTT